MSKLFSGTEGALEINTADVANDAITLAKMAPGTDGQIITYDASGNPSAGGPGTDGQVLTSTGAGSPPAFEAIAGGGYEFVSTTTASGAANYQATGLASGYDYKVTGYSVKVGTDGQMLRSVFGTGSTPTYQTTNYTYAIDGAYGGTEAAESHNNASNIPFTGSAPGNSTNEQGIIDITIYNPADTANYTHMLFQFLHVNTTPDPMTYQGGGFWEDNTAVTALKIEPASGTLSGEFKLYRRANA